MADRAADDRHSDTEARIRDNEANTLANARVLRDFLLRVNTAEEERFTPEEV
ncbi:MAG TPA: hypothetical protein VF126_16820 [Acidobacteriaceae bacterium]